MTNLHKSSKLDLRVLSDNRVILVISILKFDFEVIRERKLVSFVEIIQHKVILQLFQGTDNVYFYCVNFNTCKNAQNKQTKPLAFHLMEKNCQSVNE